MGAAEVAALLKEYRGSYIWHSPATMPAAVGSRNGWHSTAIRAIPRFDAVDSVERIPIAETRNYVQRVLENLQVYRARFGASTTTVEPNPRRAATVESRAEPTLVDQIPQ